MSRLRRLIYASQASPSVKGDLPGVTSDILEASVRNNSRVGVTGMLLAHGDWFLQALEGSQLAVGAVYDKVVKDSRHQGFKVISDAKVEDRRFERWAMCGRAISRIDDEILGVLALKGEVDPHTLNGGQALKLLTTIQGVHTRVDA